MARRTIAEQSAVLAWRRRKRGVRILLVTSLETRRWVLPKGNVEDGLTPRESALREAFEEAGIEGDAAGRRIGAYLYRKDDSKGGGLRRVAVFPMQVTRVLDDWPEKDRRRREWMSPEDAAAAVAEKKLARIIARFARGLALPSDP